LRKSRKTSSPLIGIYSNKNPAGRFCRGIFYFGVNFRKLIRLWFVYLHPHQQAGPKAVVSPIKNMVVVSVLKKIDSSGTECQVPQFKKIVRLKAPFFLGFSSHSMFDPAIMLELTKRRRHERK
jgi:hypothetical protein